MVASGSVKLRAEVCLSNAASDPEANTCSVPVRAC